MANEIKIGNKIIFNFISWCISAIPIVLIFSNSIADIIVVISSFFFLYLSIKNNNWDWLNESWIKIGLVIYFHLVPLSAVVIVIGYFGYLCFICFANVVVLFRERR